MSHPQPELAYQIYILRYWLEPGAPEDANLSWRFSLEDPSSKTRYGFQSLKEMANFLKKQTSG